MFYIGSVVEELIMLEIQVSFLDFFTFFFLTTYYKVRPNELESNEKHQRKGQEKVIIFSFMSV